VIGTPAQPADVTEEAPSRAIDVLRIRPFLLLWLSQLATQIGGNMVLFGLTVVVYDATGSNTAVSILLLTFLGPAVLFSAVAGVFVDRLDRRLVLAATNIVRVVLFALMFVFTDALAVIFLLNLLVSTATVFFVPAESSMIPIVVPRKLLLSANSLFVLTLNASFAVGFALLGPLVVNLVSAEAVLLVVAALYLVAFFFCLALPSAPPPSGTGLTLGTMFTTAGTAIEGTFSELKEGLGYIRGHPSIRWSLAYLAITASLIGILGVLGPDFATEVLGLRTQDFVIVVLPLAIGVVGGVLVLNAYGGMFSRRRIIEVGLVALGILLALLAVAGPVARFLQEQTAEELPDVSSAISLLTIVIILAGAAGLAYAFVAITSQTELQEDLHEDVRGRVFGVLNMLISVASLLPIVIIGPIADLAGTTVIIVVVAITVLVLGLASILLRPAPTPEEISAEAGEPVVTPAPIDQMAVLATRELYVEEGRAEAGSQEAEEGEAAAGHEEAAGDQGAAGEPQEPDAPDDGDDPEARP
jgi:MFS family permease